MPTCKQKEHSVQRAQLTSRYTADGAKTRQFVRSFEVGAGEAVLPSIRN